MRRRIGHTAAQFFALGIAQKIPRRFHREDEAQK
jgi:hypothetical protein